MATHGSLRSIHMGSRNVLILALASVSLLLLSGCDQRMLHTMGPKYGNSSGEVANAFEDYLDTYEPLYFAVAKNGKDFYYTHCTKHCMREINARSLTIRHCEIYSTDLGDKPDNTCRIFAKGQKVVWRGDIQGPIMSACGSRNPSSGSSAWFRRVGYLEPARMQKSLPRQWAFI